MTLNPGGRRLRQWLIEQVQSNQYPGLLWEDESRTMFRIPWKHAGKQDYNQEIDASIFKAWAMFKGKFKEGDKAEPATWKTRLRCALNKSPDFEEVTDRSQLDISEPYKVYRIVPEDEQKCKNTVATNGSCPADVIEMEGSSVDLEEFMKESSNDDYFGIIKRSHSPAQESSRVPPAQEWWSPEAFCLASSVSSGLSPVGSLDLAHSSMMVSFFYGGKLVGSALSTNPEGCRISLLRPPAAGEPPVGPDSLQNVAFPPIEVIENERQRHVTRKLFAHLDRGVLVRANREGIFIKRLCQSRVFWSGLTSQYGSVSNKLERDAVVKIFDTGRFLQALQLYQDGHYPAPDPTITLCFGEEYPDVSTSKNKLIIVQITLMSCQQQLDVVNSQRFSSGNLEIADNVQGDQIAHVFQDLCGYVVSQRTFRENLPIAI